MKRSFKRVTAALAMAALFLMTGSVSSQATGVSVQESTVTETSLTDTESSHTLSQAAWVQQQGIWYYLNADGALRTGWLNDNRKWYYLNPDGSMATGWLNLNGTWYYLNADGSMATGWLNLNGTWYYLNADGSMATGWLNLNGIWYYLNADGSMATGWLNLNGIWYYLNADGSMATGWLDLNGTWYYLNADGSMATGWLDLNGTRYYLHNDGRMAVNTWVDSQYVDSNGVWVEQQTPNDNTNASVSEIPDNSTETEPNDTDSTEETVTLEYIEERIESLKEKYPHGMYWNHMGYEDNNTNYNYYSETVTSTPCNHSQYGREYCNSYINRSVEHVIGIQCDGFARKLSDEIFGTDTGKTDYDYSFEAIKIGDYLRYNNLHSVLVIGKDDNSIQVAECNIGGTCVIRWGRTITRKALDNYSEVTCFTRY